MADIEKRNIREDLEVGPADGAITVAKTLAGVVPVVGGPLAELVSLILGSPIAKRRDEWLIYLAEGLMETKARLQDFEPENLKHNEQFISTTLQATQIAIRNHRKEKLDALRNAVLNTAIGINIDETEQFMFIEAIDALTPTHIQVLVYFSDPVTYFKIKNIEPPQMMAGSRAKPLELVLPELKDKTELLKLIANDLSSRGFLNGDSSSLLAMVTQNGLYEMLISTFGRRFLRYISDPNMVV